MHISQEAPDEIEARLRRVIAEAEFRVFEGLYCFEEYPLDSFPSELAKQALAIVRDEQVWSLMLPATNESSESFGLFSFHFKQGIDNSGFVGWLASHLKTVLGTGVLVVCGQNSERGGIFDYYGVPSQIVSEAIKEVERLRSSGMEALE